MSKAPTTLALDVKPLAVGAKRLAVLLDVSERTVRTLDAAGKLPKPVTIGTRSVRWPIADIDDWLQAGCPDRATWELICNNGKAKK